MEEIEKIKERYAARQRDPGVIRRSQSSGYYHYLNEERNKKLSEILHEEIADISICKVLEIGAGQGSNLHFFNSLGVPWENIWANELLEDRGNILRANLPPSCKVTIGDAEKLEFHDEFDIVYQGTVFTSILDKGVRQQLAGKMLEMLKPGGFVLWYDFKYDNPYNKSVKGVSRNEVRQLFSKSKRIEFHNVTLAPPIGRKVGGMYNLLNTLFPILRTHLVAVIKK